MASNLSIHDLLKYRLMNIRRFFLLTLFRIGAISLIIMLNAVLIIGVGPYFRGGDPGLQFVALAFLFLIDFLYLTRGLPVMDRFFFKSKHTLEKLEKKFIASILSLKNLDDLTAEFENVLNEALSIEGCGLYIKDDAKNVFTNADGRRLNIDPALPAWFSASNRFVLKRMVETNPRCSGIRRELQRCFEDAGGSYAIPMVKNDELIALVFLPGKSDSREIEADEIEFIDNITNSLAVAISNAIMYKNISDLKNRLEDRSIALTREIQNRIQAEAERRKSKEKYRIIAKNVSDAIWILDPWTLTFTYASPSIERLSGWTPDELKGAPIEKTLTPASMEQAGKVLAEEMALERESAADPMRSRSFELEQVKKDGIVAMIEVKIGFIRDNAGKITGVLGVGRDIQERKKVEARLRTARKMEAIGGLAGGVAHDLNNILSGIINYPELLLLDLPGDSPLRAPIKAIRKSGEKAAAIVQDLLTLARKGVASREVLNLNHVITDYLNSPEFIRLRKHHPGVVVKCSLDDALLNISGSKVHLQKTVMNLTSNAAEAMPDGGEVLISTDNRRGESLGGDPPRREKTDHVILTVSDTGIGIPPEDLERIYEPFYTKKKMGRSGTGLGMSVVWGTIRDHGGTVEIESREGEGTTFTIRIPAVKEEIPGKTGTPPMEEYMGRGETILIVDDVREQREVASGILTKLGYSTITVSSGEEAVEYMKHDSADLILLDMIMDPGIDGLATYKRILELHPGQKAIIASGYSETRQVREALQAGAGKYIKKPYLLEKIGMAVREELDR